MYIKEISYIEFENFISTHPLNNLYHTKAYATVLSEYGYDYEFVGLYDNNILKVAALVLTKSINEYKYGYSPRGFILDYNDKQLFEIFTQLLIKYYKEKDFTFIKVNPNILISKYDKEDNKFVYNNNIKLIDTFINNGYIKLKDNLYFESMLPKYIPIINLNNYTTDQIDRNTRNRIFKSLKKGLTYEIGTIDDIKYLNTFEDSKNYFNNDFYDAFDDAKNVDLFIIKIDTKKYFNNTNEIYKDEIIKNGYLTKKSKTNTSTKIKNKKVNSDSLIFSLRKDIEYATKLQASTDNIIIGTLLVHKNDKKVTIIKSAYDTYYKSFLPNYYAHYAIIQHYKRTHNILNINYITGDFSKDSPYYGLNKFKMGFNPTVYEYIGEFDLIVNKKKYNQMLSKKLLSKEFKDISF